MKSKAMRKQAPRWALVVLLGGCAFMPCHFALAGKTLQTPEVEQTAAGTRLSELLRKQGWVPPLLNSQGYYLPGLVFSRQHLLGPQQLAKQQLLTALYMANEAPADNPEGSFLSKFVDVLPVTGRLPLVSTDADFMTLHPNVNPTLLPGDRGTVPQRPQTIVVVGSPGVCEVPYFAGVTAQTYAQACFHGQSWWAFGKNIDQLWVVQPTGEIKTSQVGQWNADSPEIPMPGAWIVAPYRNSKISNSIWADLAAFLSTQGVANIPKNYELASSVIYAKKREFDALAVETPPKPLPITANDFGLVGLIQTPSARMREAGNFTMSASRVDPYTRYNFIFQPFDWLETGFRYTYITNRLYGPASFSGNQKYLDKNIDLKFRLKQETPYLPQVSLGLQDIGGTGLFAGEYLVGSKRFGNFDTSLGLGWGYLGNRGTYSNPFSFISNKFNTRPNAQASNNGQVGQLSTKTFFRGRTALFGGVQWQTPIDGLVAKVELDGNNYASEPLANPQVQSSRVNYGIVYRINKHLDFGMNVERGEKLGFVLSLHENLATFNVPKLLNPKPVPASVVPPEQGPVNWQRTFNDIKDQTGWNATEVQTRGSEVRLKIRNGDAAYYTDSLDRATAVLNRDVPNNVSWFSFQYDQNGVDVGEHVVDRKQWVTEHNDYTLNGFEKQNRNADKAAVSGFSFPYRTEYEAQPDRITNQLGLGYQQVIGGADGYLFQLNLQNDTRLNLNSSTWVDSSLTYRFLGNFSSFTQTSNSLLPHVRSDLQRYGTASRFHIANLQLNHLGKLSENVFYSAYAGLLEDMFAGAGGEVLYRPFDSRLAWGLDLNAVRQRGYREDFSLLPYSVKTGHLTMYYDTGISDVLAKVSVGQYLAGDKGVTVDLSRMFNNGVVMGAFASKTNVSAAQFGEGSFDKGIYVQIPFNSFLFKTVPSKASFLWRPLTRDGAAKLNRTVQLYDETQIRSPRTLDEKAGPAFGQTYP